MVKRDWRTDEAEVRSAHHGNNKTYIPDKFAPISSSPSSTLSSLLRLLLLLLLLLTISQQETRQYYQTEMVTCRYKPGRKERFSQRGAIVRIRLRNFMTYADITLKPGSNLNMILGPNGTGKSAIVCSIIVGLAGDVSLTGRANSITGLVQKGCDWCSTEIELYNDQSTNYIIHRKIIITGRNDTRLDHKSEWRLNDRTCTKAEICKLTSELNIKVDNLCQFLPQDSVAAFVKMNSCELLTSTLKAAGDNQLVEDHTKLVSMTTDISENERKLDSLKRDCQHNEVNARRLEADVEKLRERQEMVKLKSICAEKIHYARYTEAKANVQHANEAIVSMQADLRRAESSCAPYQKAVQYNQAEEGRLKLVIDVCEKTINSASGHIERIKDSIETRKLACQEEFSKFRSKKAQEDQRERTVRLKHQELEALESKLHEAAEVDYADQIAELDKDIHDMREQIIQHDRQRGDLQDTLKNIISDIAESERDRERILAVREKKINLVRLRRPEAYKVMTWLEENKEKFKGRIFHPMMVEINVKDPMDAGIIEHAINSNDLMAFVCEHEEDLRLLTNVAHKELNVRINVILTPDKTIEEFEQENTDRPSYPASMNFKAHMKDLISAPEPIMRYLYGNYQIHKLPVFGELSEAHLKYLLEHCRRFYTLDRFYNVSKSKYDHQLMTVTDTVREATHLMHSLDTHRLRENNAKLTGLKALRKQTAEASELKKQLLEELRVEFQKLADQFRFFTGRQQERTRFEELIKNCKRTIHKLSEERIDIESERIKLQESIKKINLLLIKDLERLSNVFGDYVLSKQTQCVNAILCKVARRNYQVAKRKYEEAEKDSSRLAEEIQKQRDRLKTLEMIVVRLRKSAEENILGFKGDKLDKRTRKSFVLIQEETSETLQDKLEELKARIQGIYQDKNVEAEFRRQNAELQDKRQRISDLESSIAAMSAERRQIKRAWVPSLERVISEINVNYQQFMRKLSYDGQVKLDFSPERPEDFSQYGIQIMVKYRDEEKLIPLSSTRQSGGERSVATMIYMLALQTKTSVPFRCVDEINQGMDKDNERKVFELLVQTADESSSQYFLVSPKLLSNLPYSEKMKIHVVFNGKRLGLSWDELGSDGEEDDDEEDDDDDDDQVNDNRRRRRRRQPQQEDIEVVDDDATDRGSDTEIEEL